VKTTKPLIVFCLLLAGCGRPPQMGADKDVFATVDALFTAITAHDEKQLSQCEQRLKGYFDAGTLPETASTYLKGIIETAHQGKWQSAAETLYSFMMAQRREGDRQLKTNVGRKGSGKT
jgi:hypothetical protein